MSVRQGSVGEQKNGSRVVVYGTFDLLHQGHIEFLKGARGYCNWLGVILIPERYVKENKGVLPLHTMNERRCNLLRTGFVDAVFADSLSEGLASLNTIRPDLFCLGYDQTTIWEEKLEGHLSMRLPGCQIKRLPMFAGGIHSRSLRRAK
jgi:FAD synthetase